MSDTDAIRRRRVLFRAQHRGTKEADIMIGGFVGRHIASFTAADLDEVEAMLDLLDVDLMDWLQGRAPIPPEADSPLLRRMVAEIAGGRA